MASTFRIRANLLARVAVPILFAATLSACSSIPDWVDPTTWIGGDSQATSGQNSDAGTGAAQSAPASQDAVSAQSSSAGQTPDIAAIPPKPAPPSTADEQKQVADSLAADRTQAHYSADALRGGTENAAAPPPAEGTGPQAPEGAATSGTQASPSDQTTTADNQSTSNPTPDAAAGGTAASVETGAPTGAASGSGPTAEAAPNVSADTTANPPAPAPATNELASADTASAGAPATAPMAAQAGVAPAQGGTDMQATFATSKAPPLDPSVAQFVPQQILSRYQETAAAASVPIESAATAKHHRRHKKIKSSQRLMRHHYSLAALFRPMAAMEASYSETTALDFRSRVRTAALEKSSYWLDPSLFAPAAKRAVAVVAFPEETTILDRNARNRIESAARVFVAHGGGGYVRVVGRASDLAASLSRTTRLRNNFERSEAQATAVARELIRDGIPPQKVLIEAVGDSPTTDHASVQAGRSAEIFLQS